MTTTGIRRLTPTSAYEVAQIMRAVPLPDLSVGGQERRRTARWMVDGIVWWGESSGRLLNMGGGGLAMLCVDDPPGEGDSLEIAVHTDAATLEGGARVLEVRDTDGGAFVRLAFVFA